MEQEQKPGRINAASITVEYVPPPNLTEAGVELPSDLPPFVVGVSAVGRCSVGGTGSLDAFTAVAGGAA